jgi:hypothetical protein
MLHASPSYRSDQYKPHFDSDVNLRSGQEQAPAEGSWGCVPKDLPQGATSL